MTCEITNVKEFTALTNSSMPEGVKMTFTARSMDKIGFIVEGAKKGFEFEFNKPCADYKTGSEEAILLSKELTGDYVFSHTCTNEKAADISLREGSSVKICGNELLTALGSAEINKIKKTIGRDIDEAKKFRVADSEGTVNTFYIASISGIDYIYKKA